MVEIFKYVDKFFISLTNYLTYNHIFLIFVGLTLFTMICVLIFTSRSYESRLIKAVDRFNSYFIDNPQINEENLVSFNAKMKDKKVPKQLRKSWQQFVLYREAKASTYMSFENCVSNPMKNSTYKRDIKIMNILSWIFSLCSIILNCYYCFETSDVAIALRSILLTPIVILLLNYLLQVFLNIRHTAIVSDLFQNYQYFEVNIDKATETLPEYVDYEVLFDRNEIKKGIPILYAYLQKRAEEEQRELERARLKNVEHEKFNFDDTGIAASLVLERAMQEAENYIAERKKYNQDAEQINSDITQEDLNYREITKEYNRQMQVSKETFANFKSQLEDVTSSIEANYLKKQQQQELDRQRNLERDFDTATERHKKVVDGYYAELDTVDSFIAQSRKNLETAMKSEFSTYSSKVYEEAKKVVEEREKEKYAKMKQDIINLEEELVKKNKELDDLYQKNQEIGEQLEETNESLNKKHKDKKRKDKKSKDLVEESYEQQLDQPTYQEPVIQEYQEPVYQEDPVYQETYEEPVYEQPAELYEEQNDEFDSSEMNEADYEDLVNAVMEDETDQKIEEDSDNIANNYVAEDISTESIDDSIEEEPVTTWGVQEMAVDTEDQGERRKPGRPRKEITEEENKPKRKAGRPRKEKSEDEENKPKRGRGRPRKEESSESVEAKEELKEKKGPGRPRKEKVEEENKPKRKAGRPRKEKSEDEENKPKRGRGRPRKEESSEGAEEISSESIQEEVSVPEIQEESVAELKDIDEYLKEIDDAIAAENAKLEETQKELAKKAKLKRKK